MSGQIMTIGIRRGAWTRGFSACLIVAIILVVICLILLGDFLVDWLWFSAIGYLNVFWTIIIAEAEVFFSVFVVTAIILWINGWIASRFTRSPWIQRPLNLEWKGLGVATMPELLEFMRRRLPWPLLIAGAAGLFAVLVAWGEAHNWGVFFRFLYRVPYGASDPLYDNDIAFYFFSLPAYVVDVAQSDRPRIHAAGLFLRGKGLVV